MAMIEINWHPKRRELRWFAGLWFPLFWGIVGGMIWRATGSLSVPLAVWVPAALLAVVGTIWPRLIRPLFIGMTIAVLPIGFVISHILMAVIYFGLVTPLGLVMRLLRFDPMQRRADPNAETHWIELPPPAEKSRYFRQF
jgi:hypothetical protein